MSQGEIGELFFTDSVSVLVQSAPDEMKIAQEASIRALSYLNFVIHHSQTLAGSDLVWVRKQIKLKTQRLEKCGLEAQHTLLIGTARLRAELAENVRVVGDGV